MIELGKHHELTIAKDLDFGLILTNEEGDEILLPRKHVPGAYEIGGQLRVFVYKDNQGRPIATTLQPKGKLNDFAVLQVRQITPHGAFLDWGIEKDLLVPFREQAEKMQAGKSYLVFVYLDEQSERLVATSRIGRFLENESLRVEEGEEVEVMLWEKTDLGVNVVVNGIHKGLIYDENFHQSLQPGKKLKGYIQKIRPDNKLDVSLQPEGYAAVEPNAAKILAKLEEAEGFLPFTDKSPPEQIAEQFQMSKKLFKKSIGTLYRQKRILLKPDGIYLNSD
jgi:predicted RNA-binding protein (virulence factor B family)